MRDTLTAGTVLGFGCDFAPQNARHIGHLPRRKADGRLLLNIVKVVSVARLAAKPLRRNYETRKKRENARAGRKNTPFRVFREFRSFKIPVLSGAPVGESFHFPLVVGV